MNSELTESSECIRRIASAKIGATDSTLIFPDLTSRPVNSLITSFLFVAWMSELIASVVKKSVIFISFLLLSNVTDMERAVGLEPTTLTLARSRSTN